jgi:hypothetical protein
VGSLSRILDILQTVWACGTFEADLRQSSDAVSYLDLAKVVFVNAPLLQHVEGRILVAHESQLLLILVIIVVVIRSTVLFHSEQTRWHVGETAQQVTNLLLAAREYVPYDWLCNQAFRFNYSKGKFADRIGSPLGRKTFFFH